VRSLSGSDQVGFIDAIQGDGWSKANRHRISNAAFKKSIENLKFDNHPQILQATQ
jgi:hypothetical protein